jgi:hypothetical protein
MIGYRYVGARVGYGSAGQQNAYQQLQARRSRIAASLGSAKANLASITTAFANAQLNRISGEASNAVHTAVSRINAAQKISAAAQLKQIDALQAQIDQAKASSGSLNTVV